MTQEVDNVDEDQSAQNVTKLLHRVAVEVYF